MEESLVLLVLEEGTMRDDIESPAEPCADELAVHELGLPEPLCGETGEPAEIIHDPGPVEL
jgi:hypothetical protein